MSYRFLVACSETEAERDARRKSAGSSSAESYVALLSRLEPGADFRILCCVDDGPSPDAGSLAGIDAVFFAGSPIQMHEETREARRAAAFMRCVFASGVPAFGSCAGLHIAAVAAGGTTKLREPRLEAGFARGIVATRAGAGHPLLGGRAVSWDALAMHSSEVDRLPAGAIVLAQTRTTPVQAAEIRHDGGVFWGVQYHPELTPTEIASALRRDADEIVEAGLARDRAALEAHAERVSRLDRHREPERRAAAWMLGVDAELVDAGRRTTEIANFIAFVKARRSPGVDRRRSVAGAFR